MIITDLDINKYKINKTNECIFLKIDDLFIKIYKKLNSFDRELLDTSINAKKYVSDIEELVLPIEKVFYKNKLVGYASNYINFDTLHDYKIKSREDYLNILKQISETLKKIHFKGLIVGDLNFSNILVNDKKIKFVDLDLTPNDYPISHIPYSVNEIYNKFNYKNKFLNYEHDKLSLIVEFLCHIFNKNSIYEIENLYLYLNCVNKNLNISIKQILEFNSDYLPYLGDIIETSDLDNKYLQLTLKNDTIN